jgi:hypothetical protein
MLREVSALLHGTAAAPCRGVVLQALVAQKVNLGSPGGLAQERHVPDAGDGSQGREPHVAALTRRTKGGVRAAFSASSAFPQQIPRLGYGKNSGSPSLFLTPSRCTAYL